MIRRCIRLIALLSLALMGTVVAAGENTPRILIDKAIPTPLKDAIDHFEADEVICNALGAEYAEMYIRAKRQEWNAYHRSVSQWGLDNYITVY